MELREKGLGGFSNQSTLGEDQLGGWAGNHNEKEGLVSHMPKMYASSSVNEVPPSRIGTPGASNNLTGGMGVDRGMARSPATIISPQPQSPLPRGVWNGGDEGGLISDTGNAYSGGYGGNGRNISSGPSGFDFQQQQHAPSPGSFDFQQQQGWPQQQPQRGFSQNQGGYQRF